MALLGIEPNGVKKACIEQLSLGAVRDLLGVTQGLAAEEARHDAAERARVELARGRERLGEDLAVAAVRAEDEVVDAELGGLADGRRLLAHREVGRAHVVVLDALPPTGDLDGVEHRLELADGQHVVEHRDETVGAEALLLGGEVHRVGVDGDLGDRHRSAGADGGRVDREGLGHV
jgi:hypothetical protein